MAWTVTILDKVKGGGTINVKCRLDDGTEQVERYFSASTMAALKAQLYSYIQQIEATYATFDALPIVGTVIDVTPPAPPADTAGSYVVSGLAMTKSASKNYLTLYNADASLVVDVTGIVLAQESTAAITGLTRGYRLFRLTALPTAGGSATTPERLDSTYPALDADITCRINGATATAVGSAYAVAGLAEDETTGRTEWLLDPSRHEPLTLRQNQGLVVQQDSTAGTGVLSVSAYFRVR